MKTGGITVRSIFLFLWLGASWLPTECLVNQVMRSFLRSKRLWSRRIPSTSTEYCLSQTPCGSTSSSSSRIGFRFASAHDPKETSAKSYFDRHSKLFGVSTPLESSSSSSSSSTRESSPLEQMVLDDEDSSKYTDYEKWVRRLYMTNLFHPVKMGLSNMQQLHDLMGNPMDDPERLVVHIAGTNGKGSVALKIATALQAQGLTVGLFCSPHVSSFRERMQVNGDLITEDEVVEYLPQVYEWCATHDIPATFFEITTALAFLLYQKRQTQVVVLETGLGGRLDATNIVKRPAISVITSIGLEHTRILGDTMELIAAEKGGIIKEGRPVLVGPHCPQDVLQQCARDKQAGPYYVPQEVLGDTRDMEITDYDEENSRISKAALLLLKESYPELLGELTSETIDNAVQIRPPCRFERVQNDELTVILDVAHNPPAMEYLVEKLKATFPNKEYRFVAGMSSDKDLRKCGQSLLTVADPTKIHLVQAAHPRAAQLEAIVEAEPSLAKSHYDLSDRSITKQVLTAVEKARANDEILVVCGSVFLMAEARQALGFDEPRDSDYIAEMAGAGVRHGQENFGNTTMPEK